MLYNTVRMTEVKGLVFELRHGATVAMCERHAEAVWHPSHEKLFVFSFKVKYRDFQVRKESGVKEFPIPCSSADIQNPCTTLGSNYLPKHAFNP